MADEFAQNAEAQSALGIQSRKTLAFNALDKIYGPIAGDPAAALTLQDYGQKEKTNPIAVQQASANLTKTGLENTGLAQTNAFNAEDNPLTIAGKKQENEYNALAAPEKIAGLKAEAAARTAQAGLTTAQTAQVAPDAQSRRTLEGAQAGEANATAAKTNLDVSTAKASQQRQATMGILSALTDAANNGADVGAEFDKYATQIAQMEGVDQAHIAPLRAKLVADPNGTINALSSAIVGAAAALPGKPGALSPVQQRAQQVDALQVAQQRTQAVPDAVDAATSLVSKMSPSAIVRKAKAQVPGTPEYNFEQQLKQISSNLSLDDLRSLRTSGLSLGRVNLAEFTASANAFANMDLGQDPSTLNANLVRLKATYGKINENLNADIKRMSVGIPGRAGANATPRVEGQVYTDAKGNKAMWKDGKFVEQP